MFCVKTFWTDYDSVVQCILHVLFLWMLANIVGSCIMMKMCIIICHSLPTPFHFDKIWLCTCIKHRIYFITHCILLIDIIKSVVCFSCALWNCIFCLLNLFSPFLGSIFGYLTLPHLFHFVLFIRVTSLISFLAICRF